MRIDIRKVDVDDSAYLADIYNHYVTNSISTFETEPVVAPEMERRVGQILSLGYPFLVAEDADSDILGYANLHPFKERAAYRHTAEISVYIKDAARGRGAGRALYERLLTGLDCSRFHTIIAGISLPNEASMKLHEEFGFRKTAILREVGRKFGNWIDVGYWQRICG